MHTLLILCMQKIEYIIIRRGVLYMKNHSLKRCIAALSAAAMMATAAPFVSSASYENSSLSFADVTANINAESTLIGDANLDGKVTVADATAILQAVANKDKFELKAQGKLNGDVVDNGDGITAKDALAIQMVDAKLLKLSDFPTTSEKLEAAKG